MITLTATATTARRILSDMQYVATLRCKCGWRNECEVESAKAAEILAERHDTATRGNFNRSYRHDAYVAALEAI